MLCQPRRSPSLIIVLIGFYHFDDFTGVIKDILKFIFTSICYLLAGALIVGIPLYLIALVLEKLN
ncbi:hypothetical protein E2636_07540 [Paenisporosarcina antarctica]|uniref:Uncharacterized protein n=1 Tax=Paenisporosarcina antarctica TaxID=417367 RepID=A0A4P6ZX69_9BACL|nr:hypothetical protein E2636_07540 [Paenisporosarcina antarctica]